MSKKLTIDEITERSGFTKKTVETVLNQLANHVESSLQMGTEVVLPGIGKLTAKATPARMARNPRTGEPVQLAASRKVKFTVAGPLKKVVAA